MPFNGSITRRVKNQLSLGSGPSRAKATVPAEAQNFRLPAGQTLDLLKNSLNRNSKLQNDFKNTDCTDDKIN